MTPTIRKPAATGIFFKRPSRKMLIGMTLLEITFVLLIMVGIIGGALVMASSTMSQSNTVQETQTVTNLAGAVRKIKSRNGYPVDASIGTSMYAINAIPTNVVHTNGAAGSFKNSWGGDITFTQQDSGGNFAITYTNVPQSECSALLMSIKPGLLAAVGTGAAPTTSSGSGATLIEGMDAVTAATLCSSASNTIYWSSSSSV